MLSGSLLVVGLVWPGLSWAILFKSDRRKAVTLHCRIQVLLKPFVPKDNAGNGGVLPKQFAFRAGRVSADPLRFTTELRYEAVKSPWTTVKIPERYEPVPVIPDCRDD